MKKNTIVMFVASKFYESLAKHMYCKKHTFALFVVNKENYALSMCLSKQP